MRLRTFGCLVGLLLLSAVLDWRFVAEKSGLQVVFVDVGQGDAALIRTPANCTVLIDGGPRLELGQKMRYLMPAFDKTIDLVVLSHPHLDHLGGLLDLEKRYLFKNVWLTGIDYGLMEYEQLLAQLNANSHSQINFVRGEGSYSLCGLEIQVLLPTKNLVGQNMKNINNSSLVLLVDYEGKKMLWTGDAEEEQELELVREYRELLAGAEIAVMKAGHHGSRTSNSWELLQLVDPEILVISAGRNNQYKHPHFETLEKAYDLGITVRRTDLENDIRVVLSSS